MRGVTLVFALTLAVSVPGLARASHKEFDFKNPSGNARCVAVVGSTDGGFVACAVLSTWTATLTPGVWSVSVQGPVGPPSHPDNWISASVPVLRYGTTRHFGVFRCTSLTIGLLCWSRVSSHGFLLSRQHQLVF
ncbi:MAG TPA: hypothetical protein VMS63_02770 [Gaiellaceae bacterium]|nr:hypothetical protein [Gaiellaceae bacterium]